MAVLPIYMICIEADKEKRHRLLHRIRLVENIHTLSLSPSFCSICKGFRGTHIE